MPRLKTSARPRRGRRVWRTAVADHVIAVAWSPDAGRVAVAAATGRVAVLEAGTGVPAFELPGHGFGTTAVAWRPGGGVLASAGQDGAVRFWDDRTGAARATADGGSAWVERLAWNADGSLLASAAGRSLRLWDPAGALVREYPPHPSTIADVAWRPDGGAVAAAAYGGIFIRTPGGTDPDKTFLWTGSPLKLAWSPDGLMLAHGNQDATVHFWYVATGDDLQMAGYPVKIRQLAWDPTSRYLATGGGPGVCVWDCGGAGPAGSTPRILDGHDLPLTDVAFQHRGGLLASAGQDGRVCVWEPKAKKAPLAFAAPKEPEEAVAVAWAPTDRLLVAGYAGGTVALYAVD